MMGILPRDITLIPCSALSFWDFLFDPHAYVVQYWVAARRYE
jgi:hypothetical protein